MFIPDVSTRERPATPPVEDIPAVPSDWSALPSQYSPEEARPEAVTSARDRVRDSGSDTELREASGSREFLLRLGVVTRSGLLTNAGAALFVRPPNGGVDYKFVHGEVGDSWRIYDPHLPLLLQMRGAGEAVASANPWISVKAGEVRRIRDLPPFVWEESLVNSLAHRDWTSPGSVRITHRPQSEETLVIVSPGSLPCGGDPATVAVRPPARRNPHLWAVFARLDYGAAGTGGSKRMAGEMLSTGRHPPVLTTTSSDTRTVVGGGETNVGLLAILHTLYPVEHGRDPDFLLVLQRLLQKRWVDCRTAAEVCGYTEKQAAAMLQRFVNARYDWNPDIPSRGWHLMEPIIEGLPFKRSAYKLAALGLRHRMAEREMGDMRGTTRITRHRMQLIDEWVEHWGSISPREASVVAHMSEYAVRPLLARMFKSREWVDERSYKGVRYHARSA